MSQNVTFADRNTVLTTGWTNPTNAYAEDGSYATAAPAQNATVSSRFGFPSSGIPAGSAIVSVTAIVKWKVSTAASIASLQVIAQNNVDTSPVSAGSSTYSNEPLTDQTNYVVFDQKPTLDDLNTAGRIAVSISAIRGNDATGVTFSLDYAAILIEYLSSGNTLASLHGKLETALRDTTNKTWTDTELDDLLTWACARMWPTVARRARESVVLVDNQEQYTLTTLAEVNRVDVLAADGTLQNILIGGSWEFWGNQESQGGTLFINRQFATTPYTLRVHGWGKYDLTTNLPVDRQVQYILALARAEACRREITRRSASSTWQTVNQVQNISANELVLMVNEADAESRALKAELMTWRRPSPATVG